MPSRTQNTDIFCPSNSGKPLYPHNPLDNSLRNIRNIIPMATQDIRTRIPKQPPRIPFNHTNLTNTNYKPKPCPTSTPWATTPTLIPSHPTPKIVPSTTTESHCWKTNRRRERKRTTPAPTEGAIGWRIRFLLFSQRLIQTHHQIINQPHAHNRQSPPNKTQLPNMRKVQRN